MKPAFLPRCLLPCLLPLFLAAQPAPPVPGDFLRFVPLAPGEGHLDTAVKHYARKADGVEVSLIAVVHVGDAAYYDLLQKRFQAYDAVLYEMIREGGIEAESQPGTAHPISQLQIGMKNLLGLEFQLDRIDYRQPNFVHADLDPDSFARLQAERGETIFGLLLKAALEEHRKLAADPSAGLNPFALLFALTSNNRAHQLKYLLGRQMSEMEAVLAGLDASEDGRGSAILSGRNEHAIKVLQEQIAQGRRRLAIFYGAGHMPDFAQRLRQLDFQPATDEWITAWNLRRPRHVEGWTVHIHDDLWRHHQTATSRALALLQSQLASLRTNLPAPALQQLQRVPLYFNPTPAGAQPQVEYHPDPGWLRDHGRNPAMAKAIEFTNIPQFDQETRRMPSFALHELAHAYHDQVLGFDHPEVLAAYQAARTSGRYAEVRRWTGDRETRDRAYAMTDHKEYFAEGTEAFFGRNDFEPFTRDELLRFDPDLARLLARLWGVP